MYRPSSFLQEFLFDWWEPPRKMCLRNAPNNQNNWTMTAHEQPYYRRSDDQHQQLANVQAGQPGLFSMTVDVGNFRPDELAVKCMDGELVVRGKHEERQDPYGFISREFTRRCRLPEDVNVRDLRTNLSRDGTLTVQAPRRLDQSAKPIDIPIQFDGHQSSQPKAIGKENQAGKDHAQVKQ